MVDRFDDGVRTVAPIDPARSALRRGEVKALGSLDALEVENVRSDERPRKARPTVVGKAGLDVGVVIVSRVTVAAAEAGVAIPKTAEMASSPAAPSARTIVFALTLSRRRTGKRCRMFMVLLLSFWWAGCC